MSNALVPYEEKELTREEQLQHIYAEVASGRSLSGVLRDDPGMPSKATFWRWHMNDADIRDNLARARLNGVEALLEDAALIADEPLMGQEEMVEDGDDGRKVRVTRKEMLGHRRLQIDTRIKLAQMIAPRRYGPKLDLTSDGEKLSSVADAIAAGNKRLEQQKD